MTRREKKYGFLLLFLLGHLLSNFISCSSADHGTLSRRKRSILCYFGLPGVLQEVIYGSLLEVPQNDPLNLGDNEDPKLENGVLRGLSTFRNLTEIQVYCNDDRVVVFSTTLGMKNAEILYNWRRSFLFEFTGTVRMKAKEVNFALEVQLNTTSGLDFKVTNSLLTKLEDFEFGFSGLGPLNPMVRGTVKLLYFICKGTVTSKIENLIKEALETRLSEINLTIDFLLQLG